MPRVFDTWEDTNVDFVDAYHAGLMESEGINEILSYDRHSNCIPGITRLGP